MKNTIFLANYQAIQKITQTLDIIWAIHTGLWELRNSIKDYFDKHPNVSNKDAINNLIKCNQTVRLNPRKIAFQLSWEDQEQYLSEILLIYATSIFDDWTNNFLTSIFPQKSNKQKKKLVDNVRQGNFTVLNTELAHAKKSLISNCFNLKLDVPKDYIDKLCDVYMYFKACRNCCSHGNSNFSTRAEKAFIKIKNFKSSDFKGMKEFPQIAPTESGKPLKLIFRGVVGFYDIIYRIVSYYDLVAADTIAIENELLNRWKNIDNDIKLSFNKEKRNSSIQKYLINTKMRAPLDDKLDIVYKFLQSNQLVD